MNTPGGTPKGSILPSGFEDLVPFVDKWAVKTCHERWMIRSASSMEEIRSFYDAMYSRAEDALTLLDRYPLDKHPPEVERLAELLLALGQASIAVEMHGQPRSPHTVWPHNIRMKHGPWPLG